MLKILALTPRQMFILLNSSLLPYHQLSDMDLSSTTSVENADRERARSFLIYSIKEHLGRGIDTTVPLELDQDMMTALESFSGHDAFWFNDKLFDFNATDIEELNSKINAALEN